MNAEMNGHPREIAIGPPLFHPCAKVVKQPARMEMIENEIAKFENPLQLRCSSCLYPSSARRRSSSVLLGKVILQNVLHQSGAADVLVVRLGGTEVTFLR